MARGIYLDNSLVAKPSDKALSEMIPFFAETWGCFSAPHQMGQELLSAVKQSYTKIYQLLGADPQDLFVFTSSGQEAVNQVFFSTYFSDTLLSGKNQFITSNIDEASALMCISRLEEMACVGKMAYANEKGVLTASSIADVMNPRTALVSLSFANGLTGVINQVQEISELCKERGVKLHLDATHVLGKLQLDLKLLGADYLTFNGDPLHAPKATGGLWCKKGTKLAPFILGGIEQGGLRAGSLNVGALVAMAKALDELMLASDYVCLEIARLKIEFEERIKAGFEEAVIFYADQPRVPHITAIGFPGVAAEALLFSLNRRGVFASIGGGSMQQLSLVLMGGGVDSELAGTAVSFSFSRFTTEEEVQAAVQIIVEEAKRLRRISGKLVQKDLP